MLRRSAARRPQECGRDQCAVYGRIENGPRLFSRADFRRIVGVYQTQDIAAFAQGESGPAIRLDDLIEVVKPFPGTLYVNFEDRSGRRRLSHFLAEVQGLGWIEFRGDEEADELDDRGAFRLVLPGIPGDDGRMDDLAWIEFADDPWT